MPGLPSDALKITLGGTIQAAQSWSTSIWLAIQTDSGNVSAANLVALQSLLRPAAAAWATSMSIYWDLATIYNSLKVYYYPEGSLVATEVAGGGVTAVPGSASTNRLSQRDALVASFLTAFAGSSYRGRSYAPLTAMQLGADQQVPLTFTANIAGYYKTLLDAWNSINLNSGNVLSNSAAVASFTKGLITPVTNIRVDSLVDTQRRREDKLVSLHTSVVAV